MENISIVCVGDSSCDKILEVDSGDAGLLCNLKSHKCEITFNYGEKIPIKEIHEGFGGSALNCALGFNKIGLETKISTFVGNDEAGKNIIRFMHTNKIDLGLVTVQGETNQSSIVSFKGERTIFSYHAKRNYDEARVEKADWIYLSSAGRGSDILQEQVLRFIEQGTKIAFNPGSWQLNNLSRFSKIIKNCDVLILNRLEADLIIGDEGKIKQQLQKMNEMGAKTAVITDGKNGAYFGANKNALHINALTSDAVDSTGAGDSFSAGFVGSIALGNSLEESAKWGMVSSGSVVEQFGANKGLLGKDDILKRIKTIKSFKMTLI